MVLSWNWLDWRRHRLCWVGIFWSAGGIDGAELEPEWHWSQWSTQGVFFLAEAEGEGGKTSALEVQAEGEAEGLVFCT